MSNSLTKSPKEILSYGEFNLYYKTWKKQE